MRRFALLFTLVAAAGSVWSPAAAADAQLKLAPTGRAAFPDRSFVLTLPGGVSTDPSRVRVTENGDQVTDLTATPAGAAQKTATVLVIDASDSMRGTAIKDAVRAARVFARERNPEQRLGIVAFSSTVTTLTPLTADQATIDSALSSTPRLQAGTHMFDAIASAVSMLEHEQIANGSVVVLSDGADTGSRIGLETLAAQAKTSGIRIFTVGLHSSSFDITALKQLAAGANGEYSGANSPKDLAPIYQQLGSRLAHEILIRYRSHSDRGARVLVGVSIPGVNNLATAEYVAPRLRATDSTAGSDSFWRSAAAMVAVSLLAAVLLGIATLMLLTTRRQRTLRSRMQGFVSLPGDIDTRAWGATLTNGLINRAERSLEHARGWEAFKEELEVARVSLPAVQVVLLTAGGTLLAFMLLYAWGQSLVLALLALGVPLGVRAAIKRSAFRQRRLFGDQLADNLQVLASAMRAGHSFSGALAVAADDAAEPARRELQRVVADEKLGIPLEDALRTVMRRMDNYDLEQIVLVAVLQRETGGNTAEVVDRVSVNIRERAELRRMIDTLTAQGRLSRWVVSSLPLVLLMLITLINPAYMDPLYNTGIGRVMLALGAVLVIAGSFAIKRVVTIKV